jgi:hypothetical protein
MEGLISFFRDNWAQILVIALALHTFLKAVRDAIDSTPDTDDNWFEKLVTVIGKVLNYFTGKRA